MNQAKTIQKYFRTSVITLAGLMLLSNAVMAEEILNTPPSAGGQIQPAGMLDNSYFEYSGPEFAVEIGDKALDNQQVVKFQAEPVKEDNWLSNLTHLVGIDTTLGVQYGLLSDRENDLTASATTLGAGGSWWDGLWNKFNRAADSSLEGEVVSVVDNVNNLTIKYSPLFNGVKEELVIDGDKEVSNIYQYYLKTDNNVLVNRAVSGNNWNLPTDSIYFTDREGNYFAHFLPMVAYDSNGATTNAIEVNYELIADNIYLLTVMVDQAWMFSADRQYPVIIDPSIVHDTQSEFNNGTSLNRVEVTSDPKVQITDLPVGANINSIGLWHMDEASGSTVADSSGNSSTGTAVNSPSVITGQFSNARNFNGSSQYISLANNNSVLKIPGDITVEAWVRKPDSTAGHIVRRDDWANYALYADSVAYAWFYDSTCSGSAQQIIGTTNIADNQWHHIVYTKLGNSMSLYVDGRLDTSKIATVSLACTANSPVHIGAGVNSSDGPDTYFKGDIDEVQIYNSALTPEDVLAHAQLKPYGVYTSEVLDLGTTSPTFNSLEWAEHGVRTGDGETDLTNNALVAHWKFNETSGTTVSDSSGNGHNGTATNMTTSGQDASATSGWTANNRKWGAGAVMFDGSNDYIDIGKTATVKNQSKVTIASWIKFNSLSASSPIFYESNDTTGYSRLLFYVLTDGSVVLGGRDSDGTPSFQYFAVTPAGTIKVNQWYHLVGVYDADTDQHKIYLNGVDKTSSTVASNTFPNTNPADNIFIGGTFSYANFVLDSTRLYFRALDINEVNSLYQAGNVQLQTRTGTDSTPDDGSWEAWQPVSGSETQIDDYDNPYLYNTTDANLVSYWPMDETSGTNVDDPAGGNDGTATGTTIIDGKYSKARNFNGSGDYIQSGSNTGISGDATFTIETWFKADTLGDYGIVGFGDAYTALASGAMFMASDGSIMLATAGAQNAQTASGVIQAGQWYHAVIVKTPGALNTTTKIYLNGREYSVSGSSSTPNITNLPLVAGKFANYSGYYFDGTIDEVKVYDTNLAAATVYKNYLAGIERLGLSPCLTQSTDTNIKVEGTNSQKITTGAQKVDGNTVGLWHLDETGGSGAYLKDSSPNANHATPSGTVNTVEGISRKAKSFGGSPNYAYNTTLSPTLTGDLTIEGWFNTSTTPGEQVRILDLAQSSTYGIQISMNTSGQILIDNSGGPTSYPTTTGRYDDGKWHYVAVTRSGTTYTLYVDGVTIGTSGGTAPTYTGLYFARRQSGTSYFNGKIDEVKLSNVARTADEIAEAYRLGSNHRFHNTITSAVDLSDKSLVPVSIASDQPGTHLEVTFGESEFANNMPDTNTVGLWHLEEQTGSGAYIKDSSSYAQNGTPTGTTFIQGKIGQGRSFNGSSDYVNIPDDANNSFGNATTDSAFSVSAWIYRNGNNNDPIISKDTGASVREWQLVPWSDNYLYWAMYDNDGANRISKRVPNANVLLSSGSWHYVVANYDGSGSSNGLSVYIDGRRVDSSTDIDNAGTYVAMHDTTSPLRIGNGNPGTYYFNGRLDEVRLDKVVRTADEIRQAYEVGLRTHPVTIDFAASLDSGNLISGSGDTSFTIDATTRGLPAKGSYLFVGDKIIVRENYDGTEYIAQGTVTSTNISTGAATVASWDAGGTFPSGGYTANADIFKWQKEYIDLSDVLDSQINAVNNITWRVLDGNQGRSFWIDDFNMVSNYLTNPTGSTITSTPQQYFQFRIIETTTDTDPTPAVSAVTLDYSYPLTMTGGSTSQSYLYNGNKNAFNVQCNGVTIAQTGKTVYCEGSWNQTNWYTVSSAASPLSNATIEGTPDVASWTGYPAGEGNVTLYVRAVVDSNPTSTYNFSVTKDTTAPAITAITSVTGDPTAPYYDVTDDSSTLVVYTASADAASCKWDETDITYTAMTDTCTSTTNCTFDLSGYGAKTVYMACADTAGNYTAQIDNYQLDYTIGGVSMTGATSSMSAINNYNKTAYNIQCNGLTKPQAGTVYCYASFDQSDWHEVDQTTAPVNSVTMQDNVDVTGWTGYVPDGDKTIYAYVTDGTNDSEIYYFASHVDTVYPVINSITSVAGDTTAPYEDASNNASTFVVFDASTDSDECKWSTNATHDYDAMPNSCGVAGNNCNLTLTGVAPHTAYIRCIDTHGNKQQSSLQVDYEITSEAPVEAGWLYYRDISISPATSLNNYQVKIELTPGNFDYANAQDNGEDIRFFDVLGETKYDYWIENWNTAGTSEIWVEIPDSGTSAMLMEYGNSSATSESNYDNVFIRDYSYESGLSGQWLMNEGTGSTVADSSGQGNNGTRQGSAFWRDSEGGQWDGRSDIKFANGKHIYNNGADSDSRINIADAPELDLTTGATVEMWINPWAMGFGQRWTRILSKGQESANMYALIINDSYKPYFYLTGPNNSATANTVLTVNRWYHVVGTYDGTNIKIYINGQIDGTTNAPGTISTNNQALAIGNNADGSTDRPFYGYYDDTRVYSRALSAGEILAHYEHRKYDAANPQTTVGGVRTSTDDEAGQENWFDDAWAHRTELTIINEGNSNTLTDYQVQLNIDTKIYIDQSQMQADGDDIRFADSDGITLMPYYIISGVNTNNTRIYVKIPSIPANNNKTIYMYYGNPAATAYQNFDNTFTKNSGFAGLAGSWHFDEGTDNSCSDGDDVCDDSGNANNGVFNGAPVWQADEGAQWDSRTDLEFSTGDHLYFDGTDDYINVGNGSSMYQAGNHLVVSAWVKPTVSGQRMPIMAQRDAACGTYPNWQFDINDSNKLYFQVSNGAFGSVSYVSTATIEPNIWTHVVMVYDGVYVNFYKNGQFVDRSALNALMYIRTAYMTFIGTQACGDFFEGYMDEVKLYTTKLNASQVLGLYEHRQASEPEPQAGYYRPSYEEVAGEIGSGTWTSGSTIYVSGPTTITAGSTLRIEPGTVIKFDQSAYIVADGATIVAEGESGNPIFFTSIDDNSIGLTIEGSDGTPAAGDWNGVYVIAPDTAGSFKFCDFNYGGETIVLDGTTFRGQLNTKGVDMVAYNNVFNNSANADIFVYQASPDIQRNNLGDSPYGIYIEANGSIISSPVQYNSFANTTIAAVYIDGLPDTDNNGGPGLTLRNNDIDSTNTGFYIDNPSGTAVRDSNAENTVDARQNSFANVGGYMCYYDIAAGNCKFDRTGGGEILFDTNSAILTAPNGGEAFFAGSLTNITWNFNNGTSNGDHVNIYLSTDSGAEFDQTIVADIKCDGSGAGPGCSGASGSYSWTVPAVSSNQTRIKVVMADSSDNSLVEDISDQDFAITVIEDKLSDYRPDQNAIHTIKLVVPQNTGSYVNDSLKVTFPNEFDLSVTAADVSASGGDVTWSASEIIDGQSITFPFTGTLNDADGVITVAIGSAGNMINNPTDEGSYRIIVTLHEGQAGGGPALWRNSTNVLINGGLAFTFNVESALEFSIRDTGDTQDITTLDFGDINVNTIYDRSHILKVTTNAYHGYTVTAHEETDLTGTTAGIPDFSGTNADPIAWASPPGGATNGYYGYHTNDSTLGTGDTARFAAANSWAAMTGYPYEVAYSNALVQNETTTMTYRLEVNADQAAGSYSHTVLYVCTAKY